MATTGQLITKAGVINDFIATVMTTARINPSGSLHSGNIPRVDIRMWDNGAIVAVPGIYLAASTFSIGNNSYPLPTTSDIPDTTIIASTIVSVCKKYAQSTTRLRPAQWGLYYTQYYNYQYTRSLVPSDNSNVPFISGTFGYTVGQAHLIEQWLAGGGVDQFFGTGSTSVELANVTNQPLKTAAISAPAINNFYSNLAAVVNARRNSMGTVDLRVCHSSCHNNCHGSRGRR
jgi:hypothetical protein